MTRKNLSIYLGPAHRTPIGKFGGALSKYRPGALAGGLLEKILKRFPEGKAVDYVFLGHARQAGAGPNPARQASVFSGISETVPAMTVNQACASGMVAIFSAIEKIETGRARHVWAGGVEVMSQTPYFLPKGRWGYRMGHEMIVDGMFQDGFFCPLAQMLMGETVEHFLVPPYRISRREQDQFAWESQQKLQSAWKRNRFKEEVLSFPELSEDEHRRPQTTLEKLAKLKPVFDTQGTVTAGNSSGVTDAAAWVWVSQKRSEQSMARVIDYEVVAIDPKKMGLGPVGAVKKLLKRQKLSVEDLESVELNEAFAAQVLACQRELKIPPNKLNPDGGAIAMGHPIGATGARIVVTLLHRLLGKKGALGLATLCVSGGMGVAILVEMLR